MIITTKKSAPKAEIDNLISYIESFGLSVCTISGTDYNVYGVVGDTSPLDQKFIASSPAVFSLQRLCVPYKKANRDFHLSDSIIDVSGIKVGAGQNIVVIGGPCSIENRQLTLELAKAVRDSGGTMFRGGAYKPRSSPYDFQGVGSVGLDWMQEAKKAYGLPIVSEIMSTQKLDEFEQNVDLIQVGARNMQNFDLLKALGKSTKPILLKRGLANTIEEWIMSAEYIMAGGNENVIFCERGIRTFEKYTRNTLDLSVIPIIKQKTHLPIIIDPSHATGDWRLVEAMSLAAIAAGCDGLLLEVHTAPECAMSDGAQSLKPENFKKLIEKGKEIAKVIGRGM